MDMFGESTDGHKYGTPYQVVKRINPTQRRYGAVAGSLKGTAILTTGTSSLFLLQKIQQTKAQIKSASTTSKEVAGS